MRTSALPDFPWDSLAGPAAQARAHPGGIVDLSVGTPVDPTPDVARSALAAASDSPGYPTTHGTAALRDAVAAWFARRRGVPGLDPTAVLPTVGSKELVALLPGLLGLGPGDVVVHPRVAYPTYDVGARLAGATPLAADDPTELDDGPEAPPPGRVRLVWLNSPSNPTGAVLDIDHVGRVVAWARARGAVVASDECYAELAWGPDGVAAVPSLLDPRATGGALEGLLVTYSLSKQSNLAGYRAAFVAGDPALVRRLLEVRKHAGLIVPGPVQAAMAAVLADDAHMVRQREVYRARRVALLEGTRRAGLVHTGGDAGLYLWLCAANGGAPAGRLVDSLAERGILVAPGTFYGSAGAEHVRMSLTASDERISAAVDRLSAGPVAA